MNENTKAVDVLAVMAKGGVTARIERRNWYQSNDAIRVFMEIRKMKGRPPVRTFYRRFNTNTSLCSGDVTDDPILKLRAARETRMLRPAKYGEIRQKVVSPVPLPDLKKEL